MHRMLTWCGKHGQEKGQETWTGAQLKKETGCDCGASRADTLEDPVGTKPDVVE